MDSRGLPTYLSDFLPSARVAKAAYPTAKRCCRFDRETREKLHGYVRSLCSSSLLCVFIVEIKDAQQYRR